MCGIAGVYYKNGRKVSAATLKAMTNAIAHRGPDSEGHWINEGVGLGHRRLAIRDLSPLGAQPMFSADQTIAVVFNGEIYNDRLLKDELITQYGFAFRSTCDTEVIVAGYQAWGLDVFDRLEGIFAIALWDGHRKHIILARDGAGTKPLYYYNDQNILRFGSEIKALLADPEQSRLLNPEDLADFFAQGYPGPDRSLLRGVRQVPPGTILVFNAQECQAQRFWRPRRTGDLTDQAEALEEFNRLFSTVVSDQMVSDVPLGILQSGGIDSSLISFSVPKNVTVPLYCVSFAEKSHDESGLAGLVAQATGHPLHVIPAEQTNTADIFAAMVHHLDGQLADSSAFPSYLVCQAIAKNARVALSGDGADEFFAGYPTYVATMMASHLAKLVPAGLSTAGGYAMRRISGISTQRPAGKEKLMRFLLGLGSRAPHAHWRRYLYPCDAKKLFTNSMPLPPDYDGSGRYAAAFTQATADNDFDRALLADQEFYLPADMLMKTDRMSMAHSLEVRVPFLDRRIMDFAGRLDQKLLLPSMGQTKTILRQSLASKGAPSALTQRSKTGFNQPINALFQADLRPLAQHYFTANTDIFSPYLHADAVRDLWRAHDAGQINHGYVLWSLLVFALWRVRL